MTSVVSLPAARPSTEVVEKASRRRFTAEYKARILREVAACSKAGELGALLRREGLYSSHLFAWRSQVARGELAHLAPKRRGPKPKVGGERDRENARLVRENAKLLLRAERAEAFVEIQKKVSQLLGIVLPKLPEVDREENL